MSESNSQEVPTKKTTWAERLFRRKKSLVLAGIFLLAVLFHQSLLEATASFLTCSLEIEKAHTLVFLGTNSPYRNLPLQEILDSLEENKIQEILLIEDRSSRVVKEKILPTLESVLREQLVKRKIKETLLSVRVFERKYSWDSFRELKAYLREYPQRSVLLLIHPLEGRIMKTLLSRVLDSQELKRVNYLPIQEVRYEITSWWKTRLGVLAVFGGYVNYFHLYFFSEPPPGEKFDPEKYSQELKKSKEVINK